MNARKFQSLLAEEVCGYKNLLETDANQWIVKGFIDVDKNVYSITNDTKVVSKIIEILLIPRLHAFAQRNNLELELPSAQNYYPDLTFKDPKGNLFAVDFKSSYYGDTGKINGMTLGSYWGYFRNRNICKNTDYPYNAYKCHLVIGMLYRQVPIAGQDCKIYGIHNLREIRSVIEKFIFFVQPKWKIASDRIGSGNTRNIGSVLEIDKLVNGMGTFAELGEDVFDDYWMNYYSAKDAQGMHYHNLASYRQYIARHSAICGRLEH
ncbi:MAG: restriction endonuclease [Kiritimatiellae bacterium]|nr:restriction endonuclease [Kiritimatiellia bacterium]